MKKTPTDPPNPAPMRRPREALHRIFPFLAWTLGALASAALVFALLLLGLVNVDGVHRYLLKLAQKEASAKLGTPVRLQNFSLDLPVLRLDLYGLTIDGAAPYQTPPVLRVNHVEADVRIVSLLRFKWYLNRLVVDHPVAWILEGAQGESNIPIQHGGAGKSRLNLFSLAIRHVEIAHGAIYFNDRPHAFDAELHDLSFGAGYSNFNGAYLGQLAYKNGRIRIGALQPMPHTLEASFSLTPTALNVKRAILTSGRTKVSVAGTLRNFGQPDIHGVYEATLDMSQLKALLHNNWIPTGLIRASGSISYHPVPSRPVVDALTVNGSASSSAVWLRAPSGVVPAQITDCQYSLTTGEVTLHDFRARLLGGEVTANGAEKPFGGNRHGSVVAKLDGISLARAERVLLHSANRPVILIATLTATAAANWGATLNSLTAKLDASAAGSLNPSTRDRSATRQEAESNLHGANPGKASIPVQGELHATYTEAGRSLQLVDTYLRVPGTSLALDGAAGRISNLSASLQSKDLSDLVSMVTVVLPASEANEIGSLGLAGNASFQGKISGPISAPRVSGALAGSNLRVDGSAWKSFHTAVSVSPSEVRLENASGASASRGEIQFDADAVLNHWSFGRSNAIKLTMNARELQLADLMPLTRQSIPVNGSVNASIQLHGTAENPQGAGTIQLAHASAYNQPVKLAKITFAAGSGTVKAKSKVEVAGGSVDASANLQLDDRSYTGQIRSLGLRIAQLKFLNARGIKATGDLLVTANGHGSFDNPQMSGDIQISHGSISGHNLPGVSLQVNLVNRILSTNLSSSLAHAPVKAHATIALTGDYATDISVDTDPVPLQPLLAVYSPGIASEVTGRAQVHFVLRGPLKDRRAMSGQITIPILAVSYSNKVNLAASHPIEIDYKDRTLDIKPAQIRGTDTDLSVQGTIPVYGRAPISLKILGSANLQMARLFYPTLRSSGTARIDIHSGNGANGGEIGGEIDIADASLSCSSFPVGLQNGNGVLTMRGNRIDITKFDGSVGGGTVKADGGLTLRPKLGFDLGMTATNVPVLYPQGVRENLNAQLRFTGSMEQALLGGSVSISDVSFTPAFDMTSMIGQFSSGISAPTTPGFTQNVALNIAVRSTNSLTPSSRTVSVAGTTDLFVRGTMAHPALVGRVNLTGGSMIFHGDRFVLTGGTIQFVDPNQIRPVLNLSLSTTIEQYDIDLRFTGPADQLQGEYTSNPSLPRADIISLLAFGTTTEDQASNPTPANQAAESLIASQVSSQVTSRISKIAGISQLSISPVLTSGTVAGPPGAVITVRQQITGNLFITFSTNVASTQDETVQGEYKLSPRVSISATRDPEGGFAVDTLIKKSW